MTLQPQEQKDLNETSQIEGTSVLEDLFLIGYVKSKKIKVYQDDKFSIEVTFRTLTPIEWRDTFEISDKFYNADSRSINLKLEILSRAICTINDSPLSLDLTDKEMFKAKYDREPDPLDQARYIIREKVRSLSLIDLIFEAYQKFDDEIKNNFEDIKKKLNNP